MCEKISRIIRKILHAGSILLAISAVSLHAAESDPQSRVVSVGKLVEESSASRRIAASGNRQAVELQARAQSLLEKARHAIASSDQARADGLLARATKTMFEAVRILEQNQDAVDKQQRDFDARLESVTALCEAYDRISREKGLGSAEDTELYPIVRRKLDAAKALRSEGRVSEGKAHLDEAYVAAKVGIEHLRGGDTLVRSLDFKSSEEEYHYEVDRNDTHRMLVQVLLKEKMGADSGLETRVSRFMDSAETLRTRAEGEAGKGNYEAAITTLEESTREIVKAIRSAGIYIPG